MLPARLAAYHAGLSLLPPQGPTSYMDTPSLLHLDNCLRLLDSCLLGSWSIAADELTVQAAKLEELRESGITTALIALCAGCGIILRDNKLVEFCSTGLCAVLGPLPIF